ncbi:MAG: nucleotidyltransferase family protein [Solirubrobacterales bacterium]|jgi:hypothetical protein|nr:nucleotidyltransferase family protein [Solirubrobacterales bacterium]
MNLAAVHAAVAAPLDALDEAGVRWCVIHGEPALSRAAGDIHLLVHRNDLPVLRICVARAGGFAPLPAWGRGSHRFFIGFDVGDGLWVKLDVATKLSFGPHQELPTPAANALLARTTRSDGVAVPAPADSFWALLLHRVLDRGSVRAQDADRLADLAAAAEGAASPLADVVAATGVAGGPEWFVAAARDRRWGEMLRSAVRLRAGWPGTGPVRRAARMLTSRVLRRAGGWPLHALTRGPSLALVGGDATVRSAIVEWLESSWPAPVRTVHVTRGAVGRPALALVDQLRGRLVVIEGAELAARPAVDEVVQLDPGRDVTALERAVTEVVWRPWARRLMRKIPAEGEMS